MRSIFIRYFLTHHINSYSDIVSNIFITFKMVKYKQLFRKLKKDGKEVKSGLLRAIVKKAGINFKQR